MVLTNREESLLKDDNRFVMFPIKYDDVWSMYKKAHDALSRIHLKLSTALKRTSFCSLDFTYVSINKLYISE